MKPGVPRTHRYEILPFGSGEGQSAAARVPLTLTVTCSPKHGPDHTVEVASQIRAHGHEVIVHIAARMVRGPRHLDTLLRKLADAGVADIFLVGGDAAEPAGPYSSALPLLEQIRTHPLAPRTIGVPAYPEGHPLVPPDALRDLLLKKSRLADYMTTQMCFDPGALVDWVTETRSAGVALPLYVGIPGLVDRRRLLEISLRVGVGTSLSFVRKHHGARHLIAGARSVTAHLYDVLSPLVGGELGIAGVHFFTFNRLVETVRFVERRAGEESAQSRPADRESASITHRTGAP